MTRGVEFQQARASAPCHRESAVARLAKESPVSFLAFDLLYLEGHSTLSLPYDDRRRLLEALELRGGHIRNTAIGPERQGCRHARRRQERGLEGVVIKRRDASYAPVDATATGSGEEFPHEEVVIGGWTDGRAGLAGSLGALLLGIPNENGLAYVER